MKQRLFILFVLLVSLVTVSCGEKTVRPSAAVGPSFPVEKQFIGVGVGDGFQDSRINAFIDVIRKAIIFTIGDSAFQANRKQIEQNFFSYRQARNYVVGERKRAPKARQKRFIGNSRDEKGNTVLRMQAIIMTQKLKDDLASLGIGGSSVPAVSNSPVRRTAPDGIHHVNENESFSSDRPITDTPRNTGTDYSDVSLSSVSMLAYYDKSDPALKNDADQLTYAKWYISSLNSALAKQDMQIFDLGAVEKLASERTLIQEENAGSVGVGLLLAQKAHAELYAEIIPRVTYQGSSAKAGLTVKVYVRTTGKLVDSFDVGGVKYASQTLSTSIKMSMKDSVKRVMKKLLPALKKYVGSGRFYFVRLSGVSSYRDASKFSTTVKKVDGVIGVNLKSGSRADGVYDYFVQFKGNPTDLVDRLFEILPDQPGFESFDLTEIRGNELIFTLE